jgi:periplasmic protein TonB
VTVSWDGLLAQLGRFKQYPRAARQAHIEGVVMLHFVMDAQGRVLSFEIAKSSGRPVLDTEALALIQRAQPLPALPADYPSRTLDAVVPIEFSLNG